MRSWTSLQRIVFLSAIGWVLFSIFSGYFVTICCRSIDWQFPFHLLRFPYYAVMAGGVCTGIFLLLGVCAISVETRPAKLFFRPLLPAAILWILLGCVAVPPHVEDSVLAAGVINSLLALSIGAVFRPR